MKSVLITGVSTGIGRATANLLTKMGWHVFGSVRTQTDADALQSDLGDSVTQIVFDLEDDASIIDAAARVRTQLAGRTLDGLVNNAGSSFNDPLLVQSVADFRRQLEVNLVGMFAVTRAFVPLLGADPEQAGPRGRVINISSVTGRRGPPFMGAYAASKHGVEGFSESLRRELQLVGIDVIIVAPGYVATPIWDKAEALPLDQVAGTIWEKPYRSFIAWMIQNGRKGLTPEQIGEHIALALTASKPKTRYEVVEGRFANSILPAVLPKRTLDRMMGKQLGLLPDKV